MHWLVEWERPLFQRMLLLMMTTGIPSSSACVVGWVLTYDPIVLFKLNGMTQGLWLCILNLLRPEKNVNLFVVFFIYHLYIAQITNAKARLTKISLGHNQKLSYLYFLESTSLNVVGCHNEELVFQSSHFLLCPVVDHHLTSLIPHGHSPFTKLVVIITILHLWILHELTLADSAHSQEISTNCEICVARPTDLNAF